MRWVLVLAVALLVGVPTSALADAEPRTPRQPRERGGGLRVCCGGSVGYVGGGSGTISGDVRGTGSNPAPAPDTEPSALVDGEVAPAALPAPAQEPLRTENAAAGWPLGLLTGSLTLLLLAASTFVFRRRRATAS